MARRTRSPHPGVVLIPPKGEHATWRARFEDPDSKRRTWERIDPVAVRTAEARREWAIRKSRAIAKRGIELDSGAPRATGTRLDAAVDQFFTDRPDLRESTRALYRQHADTFLDWARRTGVKTGDDITRAQLVAFRASRLRVKRSTAVEGGDKGEKAATDKARAPNTINVELRSVRAVLNYLRSRGLAARITSDDLTDALKAVDAPRERIEVLTPAQIRKLLDAAIAHDADTFAATRAEHAGDGKPGSTLRHETPVAPFLACVLLSGMRLDEALTLDWEQVDLDAADHSGAKTGVVELTTATKTKRPRDVGLEVSPALRGMLEAMRPKNAEGSVFGLSRGEARAAERRLRANHGAPEFNWQALRRTCGSYLSNSPGIYGAAAVFHSAKQLGHSVAVAEKHYLGRIRGIPATARTLETAMGIEKQLAAIASRVTPRKNQDARPPKP